MSYTPSAPDRPSRGTTLCPRKLHHHVWGGGVQILSRQLVGQGHRVLTVLEGSTCKVVHHLIGCGLGQHVGWERIPNGLHLDGDHRLDGLGPNVHGHFHGGLGVVGEHGAKFQVDDRTAGPWFRREPVRRAHLGVAIHACALEAWATEVVACSAVLVGCVKRLQALRAAEVLAPTQLREQQAKGEKIPAHHGGHSLLSNINIRYKYYIFRRRDGFIRVNQALLNFRAVLRSWATCKANWPKTSRRCVRSAAGRNRLWQTDLD